MIQLSNDLCAMFNSSPVESMPPPLISIVTVVRNGEQFVGQTIRSVLSQSYRKVEYIVVDGGSTDRTVDIIKSHEAGISKWVSEPDGGIADAFNKGLSFSTGDYVLFLNADDALANSDVLEAVANTIAEKEFPVLLYGDCDVLDRSTGEVLYRASIDVSVKELLRGHMIPQPSLFAGRSYFNKYGVFDLKFKIAMDYEWLLRGGLTERLVHVPILVTKVRNGGVSTHDRSRVVEEVISALKKNGYISSRWGEMKARGRYSTRSLAKALLNGLGLYDVFLRVRNKQASRS